MNDTMQHKGNNFKQANGGGQGSRNTRDWGAKVFRRSEKEQEVGFKHGGTWEK